ncbi:hypothetical protein K493DRAFT_50170 [Basidiobolus meristosporus CBS 931.73]|uniref:Uncharacterized protein n=1 Tax=Basidiobolus meristosporus CBS 931.73 TaxID=1314790 RepID=A0A1Y1Y0H1_9FUNG|nr:hypothetical protein K493DRAFT_50170 [Basidiobolus meristosporus CBS 931.73]|eukprot:ORX91497.1 hypothetical protein K493DRAFT_50170 [Basidiobolus meristosporus CBS 931.73]
MQWVAGIAGGHLDLDQQPCRIAMPNSHAVVDGINCLCMSVNTPMSWSTLLAEIQSESGLQLYNSIKTKCPTGPLYIDGIDRSIAVARNELEKYLADPIKYTSIYPGEILQIDGSTGTGKTEVALFLVLTTIIPEYQEVTVGQEIVRVHLGGRGKSVVFIDVEAKLRVERIFEVCRGHFLRCLGKGNSSLYPELVGQIDRLLLDWSKRVHIFRPNSTLELLSTLRGLPGYLSQLEEEFHFLFLDSPSSFYWIDRFESQSLGTFVPLHKSLVQAIREVSLEWGLVVCITNPVLLASERRENHESLVIREHLPPVWKECINYRFVIAHEEAGQQRIGRMVAPAIGPIFRFHISREGVQS